MGCLLAAHVHLRYQVSVSDGQLAFGPESAGLIQVEFVNFEKEVLNNGLVAREALNDTVHEASVAEVLEPHHTCFMMRTQHSLNLQAHSPLNFLFYLLRIA